MDFQHGCSDDEISWEREGNFAETKYPYVCHGELNAILNYTGTTLKNSRIYVALFPCNECAKAIIQSGIKEIIYKSDKYADTDSIKVSKKLLDMGHVKYRKYIPTGRTIQLSL